MAFSGHLLGKLKHSDPNDNAVLPLTIKRVTKKTIGFNARSDAVQPDAD
jgi:hypothetical protein